MRRTFNYTGRKRIPRDRISIRMVAPTVPGGPDSFEAEIGNLRDLGLSPHGHVFVEPYVGTSSMRFDFGTVQCIVAPPDRSLPEIDAGRAALFRVLVVDDTAEVGRIVAAIGGIGPDSTDETRQWLLPLEFRDLGQEMWSVNLAEGQRPHLVLNSRIPGLQDRLLTDPIVRGAIYPHALRMILRNIFGDADNNADSDNEWVGHWCKFVASVGGQDTLQQLQSDLEGKPELRDELIESIVAAFCDRGRYTERALAQGRTTADA
ncbi:MAG: hypothetical protein ACRD4O_03255 [Bryobacteraceae bacterium]